MAKRQLTPHQQAARDRARAGFDEILKEWREGESKSRISTENFANRDYGSMAACEHLARMAASGSSAEDIAARFGYRNMPRGLAEQLDGINAAARTAREQTESNNFRERITALKAADDDRIREIKTKLDTENAALHEAGHALIVLLGGGKVLSLEVKNDGSGACRFEGLDLCQRVRVDMAGAIAEGQESMLASGCGLDRDHLLSEMRAIANDISAERAANLQFPVDATDDRLLDIAHQYWDGVKDDIDSHYSFVSALATELSLHGKVSGGDVHQLWDDYVADNPWVQRALGIET